MKTRNLTRLGALALTLAMVTTSLIGGTLAKYTTTVSGTDTVTLARFGYTANDGADNVAFTTDTAVDIDLFDDLATDAVGTIAYDGESGENNMMFAPGAYGTFQIELDGSTSDVDIEMAGSTVIASATGSASTSDDFFISYTIKYEIADSSSATGTGTYTYATYDVHRVPMVQFAYDLQTILSSVVLEKGTIGKISVAYEWVDMSTVGDVTNTAFDFHNDSTQTPVDYNVADTNLGVKWADDGSSIAPTFTLTINNVASQSMSTSIAYTTDSSVKAETDANWDSGNEYADYDGATSNYTVTNVTPTNTDSVTPSVTEQYVTFNMNGVDAVAIEKAKIDSSNTATEPADPTSLTHKFVGWSLDASDTADTLTDWTQFKNGSVTVYAIWEEIVVTLDTNDNNDAVKNISGITTTELTLNSDGKVTLPTLTSSNYTFVGWATTDGASTADVTVDANNTTTNTVASDITYHAVWTVKSTNG